MTDPCHSAVEHLLQPNSLQQLDNFREMLGHYLLEECSQQIAVALAEDGTLRRLWESSQ